jgi:hypothetical protein
MRKIIDTELRGEVMVFTGTEDAIATAANKINPYHNNDTPWSNPASWVGASFASWNDVSRKLRAPWIEGRKQMESMQSKIASKIPEPQVITRRHRWSDDQGDICSDRALAGEPEFYRDTFRTTKIGTQSITLMCHVGGNCEREHDSMFWSPASAVAIIDALENAGYNCELWAYSGASNVYTDGYACIRLLNLKESGAPLDSGNIINAMSGWFFRSTLIACADHSKRNVNSGYGQNMPRLGAFSKYVEASTARMIELPDVKNESDAIALAARVINQITEQE